MIFVSVNNLSVKYNNVETLSNVNFEIESGDFYCVVGSNGSGKTSLIKAMLGLVSPSSGSIKFFIDRDEIAYVPQINTIPDSFPANCREIILCGRQKKGAGAFFYSKEDNNAVDRAIDLLEIKELEKKHFFELSGGQKQRVLLARALCRPAKLLILDEPFAALDQKISAKLYDLLLTINKDQQTSVFMVSHDLEAVSKYTSRIMVLEKEIKFVGEPSKWNEYKIAKMQEQNNA